MRANAGKSVQKMNKRLETPEMWFYRKMTRITWTKYEERRGFREYGKKNEIHN